MPGRGGDRAAPLSALRRDVPRGLLPRRRLRGGRLRAAQRPPATWLHRWLRASLVATFATVTGAWLRAGGDHLVPEGVVGGALLLSIGSLVLSAFGSSLYDLKRGGSEQRPYGTRSVVLLSGAILVGLSASLLPEPGIAVVLSRGDYQVIVAGHTHSHMVRRLARRVWLVNAGTLKGETEPGFGIVDLTARRVDWLAFGAGEEPRPLEHAEL